MMWMDDGSCNYDERIISSSFFFFFFRVKLPFPSTLSPKRKQMQDQLGKREITLTMTRFYLLQWGECSWFELMS